MEKAVENYLEKGRSECAAGHYKKAQKSFTKAIELDPDNARAYYERGMVDLDHIRTGHAIFDFEKALGLDPNLSEAYLAMAPYWVHNMDPVPEEMLEMMINFAELRPYDHWEHSEKVLSYFFTEQFDVVIGDLPILGDLDPMGIECLYYKGGCANEKLGKYEEAILAFNKSINMKHFNPKSYFHRGHSYSQLQKYDCALSDFKTAVKMILLYSF